MTTDDKTPAPRNTASGAVPPVFTPRLALGILGLLIAAFAMGLNSRLGSLGLVDIRGMYGYDFDQASWLTSFYSAGELVIIPFALWLCEIFSTRRYALMMLSTSVVIATILPFAQDIYLQSALRFVQGISGGSFTLLMLGAVLRFVPLQFKVYGFGLFGLIAVFTPNIGIWATALWTDIFLFQAMLYWQMVPLGLLALLLIYRYFPAEAPRKQRLMSTNWLGLCLGSVGLVLLILGLDQGTRLDWLNSSLISGLLICGGLLSTAFFISEWYHPAPFIRLQIFLQHRNRWVGLGIFFGFLIVSFISTMLPLTFMTRIWEHRPLQTMQLGFVVAAPQLLVMVLVPYLIYQKWVDARWVFAAGLILVCAACFTGARIDTDWMAPQFTLSLLLLGTGLPTVIICMIFMISSSIKSPADGPSIGTAINTLRGLGTIAGSAFINQFLLTRQNEHYETLRNHLRPFPTESSLAATLTQQSLTTAISSAYTITGIICLVLIFMLSRMHYMPSPSLILNRAVTQPGA